MFPKLWKVAVVYLIGMCMPYFIYEHLIIKRASVLPGAGEEGVWASLLYLWCVLHFLMVVAALYNRQILKRLSGVFEKHPHRWRVLAVVFSIAILSLGYIGSIIMLIILWQVRV